MRIDTECGNRIEKKDQIAKIDTHVSIYRKVLGIQRQLGLTKLTSLLHVLYKNKQFKTVLSP